MVLATTTSTQDSGLLDVLLPEFEEEYGAQVKTVAVGSGEAMKLGEQGDADVLLVHAKAAEEEFVKEGYGLERVEIMYNTFQVVGPDADPAGISGMKDASEALARIASTGSTFVSRGDDSGTNKKEIELWKEAGVEPAGRSWYVESGQGMGETLTMASEMQAYTLSDDATFLSMKDNLGLEVLAAGDAALRNPYSVIVVNPGKHPGLELNVEGAGDFCWFMSGPEGQEMIGSYKVEGETLFHPDAKEQTRGPGS